MEFDTDFEGTRSWQEGDNLEFESMTWGGVPPYVKAEWDFNNDGVWDLTITDATGVMTVADVTYGDDPAEDVIALFPAPGCYDVKLRMTDSVGATVLQLETDYIMVGVDDCEIPPVLTREIPYSPWMFAYTGITVAISDALTNIVDDAVLVWSQDPMGDWVSYDVEFGFGAFDELVNQSPYILTMADGLTYPIVWEIYTD